MKEEKAMKDKQTIMVVDDDPNIAQLVKLYLEKEGFEVTVETRGDEAVAAFQKNPPSLMLLDIMLPGMDGLQVCRAIRQISTIPIIMLSAKDETFDKVLGLELGADDYITKPFEGKELVARVKAVLRRSSPGESEKDTLSFPGLTISLEKYEVHYQGKLLEMPPKELEVLYFLAAHQNRVFTREQLLEQVWGFDFFGDSRTVDVHIKRLREKLTDSEALGWTIRTVWGVGYKFEVK
jgi:DNA-binding response OmpR family regulator